MKIQEIFQGTFKFISIMRHVLYLRRQTIEHPVEYFLLGITPASELSESTFRNLVLVPSSWTRCVGVNVECR
jgi:hypothetical protein